MRCPTTVPAGLFAAFLALAAGVAINFLFWWSQGRMQNLPDALEPRIKSASFSPYRRGQSPFTEAFTREQLEEDVAVAARHFERIRTYSSRGLFGEVPALAQKYGLKVMLGAWVGAHVDDNEEEIAEAIRLANAYPDTVERVIVGNEVILREEMTPELLIRYIRRVKAAIRQPVTYADVWGYWILHPELVREVDAITIHILPYWEDPPTSLDHVLEHMQNAHDKIAAAYPGKPILVGEIGWPSAGRVRRDAVPGRVAQARFVREIINLAHARGIDYNIFELFDEPWKAMQEGTVGAHWGLIDVDRHAKFPLTGPMSDKPYWLAAFVASSALAALLALAAVLSRPPASVGRAALLGLCAQLLATLLAASAEQSWNLAYGPASWLSGALMTGGGALLALLVFAELADQGNGRPGPAPLDPAVARLDRLRRLRPDLSRTGLIGLLDLACSATAVALTVGLVIDPRFRDFRVAQFLPAGLALGLRTLAARGPAQAMGTPREEWLFVAVFLAGAAAIPVLEGLINPAAWAWAGTLLLLGAPWAVAIVRQRRAVSRAARRALAGD
jgi:exo-beta-1,3-glucanase (GH17 family)